MNENCNFEPDHPRRLLLSRESWLDIWHKFCVQQEQVGRSSEQIYSYSAFERMIKEEFTDVKRPKQTTLPRCDVCAQLVAERKEVAHVQQKRNEVNARFEQHMREHRGEREAYHRRIAQAQHSPEKYLSLIVDASTARPFPNRVWQPKKFQNLDRLTFHGIGVIDHGNNARILHLVSPQLFSKNANLICSILHKRIYELSKQGPLPPELHLHPK